MSDEATRTDAPYRPAEIEPRWQARWAESRLFAVPEAARAAREKRYVLEMFPYPSGRLHMGHVRNYSIGDVMARFFRARGHDVLHPMGWDAFGLPAENAATKRGAHPADWTYSNIAVMREQLRRLGFSYDWDREVATCDADYYRFEQDVFLSMLERGLAYKKAGLLNFCPSCDTVLANEQVEADGGCWRCGTQVVQKELEQWYLRITQYADELLTSLDKLPGWPNAVTTQQRTWIGRSEGARVLFGVDGSDDTIEVFTTRPDTLFGCTFVSLAPEHPLTRRLAAGTAEADAVHAFVDRMGRTEKAERMDDAARKEGVFTGRYAINPANRRKVPIWTANFVLADYGTGAVMAVPAHDQRDFEFARAYQLPIDIVILPPGGRIDGATMDAAYTDPGTMTNSGPFDGMPSEDGKKAVTAMLSRDGRGSATVNYRLRDWGISRQRYWGAPIPVVYCADCGMQPVPRDQLPVVLPRDVVIDGQGGSPLRRQKAFVETNCPKCAGPARRETDTFDTFMESSWYFVRYCSPRDDARMVDPAQARRFLPIDLYIGGIEHAVMHLLYARFYTKVLRDLGIVAVDEPFTNLLCQGMVCHETYKLDGEWVYPADVENGVHRASGRSVTVGRVEKMSKSKCNTVDPEALVGKYGADTLRLFCLFAAPPTKDLDWVESGVEGCHRFLQRVYRLVERRADLVRTGGSGDGGPHVLELRRTLHRTIARVTVDIDEKLQFNTAISAVMELVNALYKFEAAHDAALREGTPEAAVLRECIDGLLPLLAPFAPHLCDELWERTGHGGMLFAVPWPDFDPSLVKADRITLAVQVAGKLRGTIEVDAAAPQGEIEAAALSEPSVAKWLGDKPPRRVIHVAGRLVNVIPG